MPERFLNLKTGDLVALDRLNFTESAAVAASHTGDRNPALIIASGSSDPMDIVIRIVGYIVVDNDRDPFNIDPPCEDIGGHNHGNLPIPKGGEGSVPFILRAVSMDAGCFDYLLLQKTMQFIGPFLARGKDDAGVPLQQIEDYLY